MTGLPAPSTKHVIVIVKASSTSLHSISNSKKIFLAKVDSSVNANYSINDNTIEVIVKLLDTERVDWITFW